MDEIVGCLVMTRLGKSWFLGIFISGDTTIADGTLVSCLNRPQKEICFRE